jgi:deoxynucleoside triphosphate triphosphohydrolase SAMHD1
LNGPQFVDTPQFQRLRDLKQLGASFFVFSGATHNRFEHSVGVGHVTSHMMSLIRSKQPDLDITDSDAQAVAVAGLTHDLGHGCFSHVFENEFLSRAHPGLHWHHEDMGIRMLEYLVDDNHIDVDRMWLDQVSGMIVGEPPPGTPASRQFLYEFVNNARNGIDTDKFDYLQRDSRAVGLSGSFDPSRLIGTARVIDGQICFHAKEVFTLHELFHTRYSLFKQIYTHRATKAIEFMLADILIQANTAWGGRLVKAAQDPRLYLHLTDSVLREVESSTLDSPAMLQAQVLARRLRKRELYRFVDELVLDPEVLGRMRDTKISPEDITTHNKTPSVRLAPEDVVVHNLKLNFGQKQNPIEATKFYSSRDATVSFHIPPNKVSHIIPREFEEKIVRVYSRSNDPVKIAAIQRAFRSYLRSFSKTVSEDPDHSSRMFTASQQDSQHDSPSRTRARFLSDDGIGRNGRDLDVSDISEVDAVAYPRMGDPRVPSQIVGSVNLPLSDEELDPPTATANTESLYAPEPGHRSTLRPLIPSLDTSPPASQETRAPKRPREEDPVDEVEEVPAPLSRRSNPQHSTAQTVANAARPASNGRTRGARSGQQTLTGLGISRTTKQTNK